jgi:hypothetical protein
VDVVVVVLDGKHAPLLAARDEVLAGCLNYLLDDASICCFLLSWGGVYLMKRWNYLHIRSSTVVNARN